MSPARAKKAVTIELDHRVSDRCAAMAAAANVPAGVYVRMLFEAAYAARCGETGDVALDAAVSRVALLFGSEFDVASIRQATGLSETFVGRTIAGWQAEMRRDTPTMQARVS